MFYQCFIVITTNFVRFHVNFLLYNKFHTFLTANYGVFWFFFFTHNMYLKMHLYPYSFGRSPLRHDTALFCLHLQKYEYVVKGICRFRLEYLLI